MMAGNGLSAPMDKPGTITEQPNEKAGDVQPSRPMANQDRSPDLHSNSTNTPPTTESVTNQERITAALAAKYTPATLAAMRTTEIVARLKAIGFAEAGTTSNRPFLWHDDAAIGLTVTADGRITIASGSDPNWLAIPAVMAQVAEIVQEQAS